jgi:hypothetical protein
VYIAGISKNLCSFLYQILFQGRKKYKQIENSEKTTEKILKNSFQFENSLLGVFTCSFKSPVEIGRYNISINICDENLEIHEISSVPLYLNVLKSKVDISVGDEKGTVDIDTTDREDLKDLNENEKAENQKNVIDAISQQEITRKRYVCEYFDILV